jgi:hypothetical protein
VLCNDLAAAVRAMFLSQTTYQTELAVAQRHGLAAALSRRQDGVVQLHGLAIRIAALIAFWLSDDFAQLRSASLASTE